MLFFCPSLSLFSYSVWFPQLLISSSSEGIKMQLQNQSTDPSTVREGDYLWGMAFTCYGLCSSIQWNLVSSRKKRAGIGSIALILTFQEQIKVLYISSYLQITCHKLKFHSSYISNQFKSTQRNTYFNVLISYNSNWFYQAENILQDITQHKYHKTIQV